MNLIFEVNEDLSINDILTKRLGLSSRLRNKLVNSKLVLLNGIFSDTRTIARKGDIVTIILDYSEDNSNIVPKKMDLNIVYEDAYMLIINKPAGISVHPSILHFNDSLSNGVRWYFDTIKLHKKIRPVNRIDLNTSGLVLFAKNEYIQEVLIKQMNNNTFKKSYLAVISGNLPSKTGIINLPIARKENSIIERCVSSSGKLCVTNYKVLKVYKDYSLVECTLETGRTHQIRVHMAALGHPLLGDTLYNPHPGDSIKRQALHSYRMEFFHPICMEKLIVEAPIPNDILSLL